jgi:hypothetical protein
MARYYKIMYIMYGKYMSDKAGNSGDSMEDWTACAHLNGRVTLTASEACCYLFLENVWPALLSLPMFSTSQNFCLLCWLYVALFSGNKL